MAWNTKQYLKFGNERTQPCLDLINKLNHEYNNILDLGCGPGNSTIQLQNRFDNSKIIGFDIDENMLKKAKEDNPNIEFIKGVAPNDFNKFEEKFDLVFSNACSHWIENQEALIDGVSNIINENGAFAVQIPLTDEAVFYKTLYELIDEKWIKLKSIKNFYNLNDMEYYNLLIKKFNKVSIWKSEYYHTVENKDSIIEWYKGSGLRPYLEKLEKAEKEEFLYDLREKIDDKYTELDDGRVFLIIPRLFFIAYK